jgi:hypothetical protein
VTDCDSSAPPPGPGPAARLGVLDITGVTGERFENFADVDADRDPFRPYTTDCCIQMSKLYIFQITEFWYSTFELNYLQNVIPNQKVGILSGLINKYCLSVLW